MRNNPIRKGKKKSAKGGVKESGKSREVKPAEAGAVKEGTKEAAEK